jgi:hypothetical protein
MSQGTAEVSVFPGGHAVLPTLRSDFAKAAAATTIRVYLAINQDKMSMLTTGVTSELLRRPDNWTKMSQGNTLLPFSAYEYAIGRIYQIVTQPNATEERARFTRALMADAIKQFLTTNKNALKKVTAAASSSLHGLQKAETWTKLSEGDEKMSPDTYQSAIITVERVLKKPLPSFSVEGLEELMRNLLNSRQEQMRSMRGISKVDVA